jgi:hypothetical protein
VKAEQQTVYTTEDNKTFLIQAEAEAHELNIKNTRAYRISYAPDLNETGRLQKTGCIVCQAQWSHELWVEDWLFQKFGNRIAFVQGVAPTENWTFRKIELKEVKPTELLATIRK